MTQPIDPGTRPKPLATFVVFKRQTGDILHTHHVSVAPGAIVPTDEEMTRAVLEHAVHTGRCHANEVDCVRVDVDELEPKASYRVDVAARRVIETGR